MGEANVAPGVPKLQEPVTDGCSLAEHGSDKYSVTVGVGCEGGNEMRVETEPR